MDMEIKSMAKRLTRDRQIERIPIFAQEKNLSGLVQAAWDALKRRNDLEKSLFRFGNLISRIETDDQGVIIVKSLDEHSLRLEVSKRVKFWAYNKKDEKVEVLPPLHCIKGLISTPGKPLPILKRLVVTPVFDSEGNLETNPGYSEKSETYYIPNDEAEGIRISDKPTEAEIKEAVSLIIDHLIVDFPFISKSDKAHSVALFIQIPARELINGPTPLYADDATSHGTGKGLLMDLILEPWVGGKLTKMTEGGSQDEWRKKIFAKLRQSPPCIVIDNVKNKISSSALEAALTTDYFEDRVLGVSEIKSVPVKCAWAVTGNNLQFDAEMARRTVRIRLDAQCEQPWLRTGFIHPEIKAWAVTNRKRLIWAGLTMIQAWVAAGKPSGEKVLGSYENWAKVIGGILTVCKIDGFLDNLQEFYLESDVESQKVAAFVELWHSQRGTEEVRASDLLDQAIEAGIDLGPGNDRSIRTRMGTLVASLNGKIFGKHVVTRAGVILGVRRWRLLEKTVISTGPVNGPGGRGEP